MLRCTGVHSASCSLNARGNVLVAATQVQRGSAREKVDELVAVGVDYRGIFRMVNRQWKNMTGAGMAQSPSCRAQPIAYNIVLFDGFAHTIAFPSQTAPQQKTAQTMAICGPYAKRCRL